MTVKELIELLSRFDQNKKIVIYNEDYDNFFDITRVQQEIDEYDNSEVIALFADN